MKRITAALIIWIGAVVVMLWITDWYTSIPIVKLSALTSECVDVEDPDDRYTCQTVPRWPTLTRWVP